MRDAAPFVSNPDALILSIADIEARLEQRHHSIRRLATSCRQEMKARVTSWPVLMATCVSGFLLGVHIAQSRATLAAGIATPPTGKINGALKLATRIFNAFQHLPW